MNCSDPDPGFAPRILKCVNDSEWSDGWSLVLRGDDPSIRSRQMEVWKLKDKTAQGKKTPTGMLPEPEGSNKRTVVILLFLFWIIGLIVIFLKWGNF